MTSRVVHFELRFPNEKEQASLMINADAPSMTSFDSAIKRRTDVAGFHGDADESGAGPD